MLKIRIICVVLAVVCLAGLAVTLYVPEEPSLTAAYAFAYGCIGALIGNAVLSVLELRQTKKKYETADKNRL